MRHIESIRFSINILLHCEMKVEHKIFDTPFYRFIVFIVLKNWLVYRKIVITNDFKIDQTSSPGPLDFNEICLFRDIALKVAIEIENSTVRNNFVAIFVIECLVTAACNRHIICIRMMMTVIDCSGNISRHEWKKIHNPSRFSP